MHQNNPERKLIPFPNKKTTAIEVAQRIRSEFLLEKSFFIYPPRCLTEVAGCIGKRKSCQN